MMIMFDPSPLGADDSASLPDWIKALESGGGFTPEDRYNPAAAAAAASGEPTSGCAPGSDIEADIATAFEQGRAQGFEEGVQRAEQQSIERRKLGSRLRQMDEDMAEDLGRKLSEAIVVLCEATLAPLALDQSLLAERCAKAARMLGNSGNAIVLHLHPADIETLDADFQKDWTIHPDPELCPGSLRIEGPDGGISDGPDQWRAALMDALGLEAG